VYQSEAKQTDKTPLKQTQHTTHHVRQKEPTKPNEPKPNMRQLVGQRIIFSYDGLTPPKGLMQRICRGEAAGVILFANNIKDHTQVKHVTQQLQRKHLQCVRHRPAELSAPLLVMVDQEGGFVRRVPGAPEQTALQIGRAGSDAAFAAGEAAGKNLRSVGINVDLAPVVDVARAGSAITKKARAFSDQPKQVAKLSTEFIRGLHKENVAATAKHFPGFGAAAVNTDDAPVTLDLPLRTIRQFDEPPFQMAINAGVELMMISSAIYPALDPKLPAGLSRRIMTGELRQRLGFKGVTVTDALGVPAITRYGKPGQIAVRVARAGTDLLLYSEGYAQGVGGAKALEQALRSGKLPRKQFDASVARVLKLRASLAD
jgi:beta-N-acetylhexosaminidase